MYCWHRVLRIARHHKISGIPRHAVKICLSSTNPHTLKRSKAMGNSKNPGKINWKQIRAATQEDSLPTSNYLQNTFEELPGSPSPEESTIPHSRIHPETEFPHAWHDEKTSSAVPNKCLSKLKRETTISLTSHQCYPLKTWLFNKQASNFRRQNWSRIIDSDIVLLNIVALTNHVGDWMLINCSSIDSKFVSDLLCTIGNHISCSPGKREHQNCDSPYSHQT